MKKLLFLTCALILSGLLFAAPSIKAIANGNWNQATSWDLNRIPLAGDTVNIPAGATITVSEVNKLNGSVYLKVNGRITFENNNATLDFGTGTTIIVYSGGQIHGGGIPSQKINLGSQAIFKGNDVPVIGPLMASSTSGGFTAFATSPLPVKFIGFTATRKNADVTVQWSTSEEINAQLYQVEKSTNGTAWNTIAYVAAVGKSSATNHYSFIDRNVTVKLAYYRIKQVDVDGKVAYTPVQSVKSEVTNAPSSVRIIAVNTNLVLQFSQEIKGLVAVRFISQNGQVMDQKTINNPFGQVIVSARVRGNYIISLSNGQDVNTTKQVIL